MEEERTELFRKKSLEKIESPEAMNDYLKVTSPGIWLFMAAVIAVLIGVVLWGIFGSIETSAQVAVVVQDDQSFCVAPYDELDGIFKSGVVTVDGADYALGGDTSEAFSVTESTDVYIRIAGGFAVGDIVVAVAMEDAPAEGVYTGTVVTERLRPASLLLQ